MMAITFSCQNDVGSHVLTTTVSIGDISSLYRYWWNTGIFPLLKNHIFIAHSEDTIFYLSRVRIDIGVAMVTNINFYFLEQKI